MQLLLIYAQTLEKLETVKGYNHICIVQSADFQQVLHCKSKIGHKEMKATFSLPT